MSAQYLDSGLLRHPLKVFGHHRVRIERVKERPGRRRLRLGHAPARRHVLVPVALVEEDDATVVRVRVLGREQPRVGRRLLSLVHGGGAARLRVGGGSGGVGGAGASARVIARLVGISRGVFPICSRFLCARTRGDFIRTFSGTVYQKPRFFHQIRHGGARTGAILFRRPGFLFKLSPVRHSGTLSCWEQTVPKNLPLSSSRMQFGCKRRNGCVPRSFPF